MILNPVQQATQTLLAAMDKVGLPEDIQVAAVSACIVALCCARSRTPAESHKLATAVSDAVHSMIDDAWTQADPILKALQGKHR